MLAEPARDLVEEFPDGDPADELGTASVLPFHDPRVIVSRKKALAGGKLLDPKGVVGLQIRPREGLSA